MNVERRVGYVGVAPEDGGAASEELQYRLRQQELLAEFGVIALKATDFQSLLEEATRLCAEGLQVRFAKVMEYLRDEKQFVVRAGVGWKPGTIGARCEGDLENPAGYTFHTAEPTIANQSEPGSRFRTPLILAEHGVKRSINVIIATSGRRYGVLEGDSRTDGKFTDADIAFLQGFANLVGVALERKEGEERYRLAVKAASDAIWDWDLVADQVVWNEALTNQFGYAGRETSGTWWKDHIHPDDKSRVAAGIKRAIAGSDESWTAEYRFLRSDGSEAYVLDRGSVIRDEGGRAIRMVGAMLDISEQKKTEIALRESEARLRIAQEAGGIGTYEWDIVTGDLWMSRVMRRMWGLPETGPVSLRTAVDVVHPDDRHLVLSVTDKPLEEAVGYTEYRIVRPDTGDLRWMARKGEILRDQTGKPRRVIGAFYDITDRMQAEAALRASEARLSALMEHLPLGVGIFGQDGRVILGNAELRRLLGDTMPSFHDPARSWRAFAPDGRQLNPSEYPGACALRGEAVFPGVEFLHRKPDGSDEWIRVAAVPLQDGARQIIGAVSVLQDVTEAKRAEAALRASEEFNRRVLESSSDCIKVLDTDARLQFMSPGGLKIMEVNDFGAIEGCDWREFWSGPDHDKAHEAVRTALAGGNARFQGFTPTMQGKPRWWDVAVTPMTGPQGEVDKLLSVSRDITEAKQSEEHQRVLLNELNHRVKNTLATVQSIATQTLRNAATTEEAQAAIESRLFALSRAHDVLTRENWESANLREIVAQAVEPYSNAREDRLHMQGPDVRLPPRTALALAMALQELATNAVKYGALSNETGEVQIEWLLNRTKIPPCLHLTWQESGGPPVKAPSRRGFGSRLVERSLAQDLDGEVRIEFLPKGVQCTVAAPILDAKDPL